MEIERDEAHTLLALILVNLEKPSRPLYFGCCFTCVCVGTQNAYCSFICVFKINIVTWYHASPEEEEKPSFHTHMIMLHKFYQTDNCIHH